MKKYECVVIIKSDRSKIQINSIIQKIRRKIDSIGRTVDIKDLGIKQLAYPLKNYKYGYYMAYKFETGNTHSKSAKEVENFLKTQDAILRYIIVGE